MTGPGSRPRRGEAGFSLVVLLASIAIMTIMMGAAVPSWRYVMQNAREEELIFRGGQIAEAIERYQRKNGNALPVSLEVLAKGKYLRREYKDPMTKSGEWRLVRPGEAVLGGLAMPPGARQAPSPSPPATPRPAAGIFGTRRGTVGAFMGVASTSTDKSLRIFNGRSRYNEWLFIAGQPRVVGKDQLFQVPPGALRPGVSPPGVTPPGRPHPNPAAPR